MDWFVLGCDGPEIHTECPVFLKESHKVVGPGIVEFRLESTESREILYFLMVGFHPHRRTPGTREELYVWVKFLGFLHKGNLDVN